MASVRYIAHDVDKSVDFYRDRLGFEVEKHNPGKFAEMTLDDLHLFLNAPGAGSAGKAGGNPQPGGWSRFMVVTDDLDGMIGELRHAERVFVEMWPRAGPDGRSCSRTPLETWSSCSNTQNPPMLTPAEKRKSPNI